MRYRNRRGVCLQRFFYFGALLNDENLSCRDLAHLAILSKTTICTIGHEYEDLDLCDKASHRIPGFSGLLSSPSCFFFFSNYRVSSRESSVS